jgi:hypothetical protein
MTPADAARHLVRSRFLRRLAAVLGDGAYLVGGALRDRLLGIPTHDVDLVVEHDPAGAAQRLAASFGGRAFPLGRPPLVTWRVAAGARHFDIWEIERSLEADIWRRDLTVNALFWRLPRGPLLDPTGGLDDLAARRLRVVRASNLDDDPLRVLRAVRLMSTHPTLAMTSETERLVAAAAPALVTVAHERVTEELRRLLAGPGAGKALAVAERLGVLGVLSPAWARWPALGEISSRASTLADLQGRPGGVMREGAAAVAPALLAAPAAGFPASWDTAGATAALEHIGYPARAAAAVARAAGLGEELARPGNRPADIRVLAWEAAALLPAALAWAAAGDPAWLARAAGIRRWQRAFDRRPPLLGGDRIVAFLALPAGPQRAEAVRVLRRAEARQEVRTRRQAELLLRSWHARIRGRVDSPSCQC